MLFVDFCCSGDERETMFGEPRRDDTRLPFLLFDGIHTHTHTRAPRLLYIYTWGASFFLHTNRLALELLAVIPQAWPLFVFGFLVYPLHASLPGVVCYDSCWMLFLTTTTVLF